MNNQIEIKAADLIHQDISLDKPYPPSFVDKLMEGVERLPVPYWVTYFALFALLVIANHIVSWADGSIPPYTFNPLLFLYPMWFCFPLAIMTYLNSVSREALSEFAPLLELEGKTMRRLEYEFTTMPQKGVILSSVFWVICYVLLTYLAFNTFIVTLGMGQGIVALAILEGLVAFLLGSAIYYHSIRQLRLVNKTVNTAKQFNLFRLDPVYAFSTVTSRTGIAWVGLLTLTLLVFPIEIATVPTFILLIVQILFATAAFMLPLRIVNQRLVSEKRRLLAEHARRFETTLAQLDRSIKDNAIAEGAELGTIVTGLESERNMLDRLPTWPWRSGMLPGFLSIVVLPIILFLIQLVLGNWLGL